MQKKLRQTKVAIGALIVLFLMMAFMTQGGLADGYSENEDASNAAITSGVVAPEGVSGMGVQGFAGPSTFAANTPDTENSIQFDVSVSGTTVTDVELGITNVVITPNPDGYGVISIDYPSELEIQRSEPLRKTWQEEFFPGIREGVNNVTYFIGDRGAYGQVADIKEFLEDEFKLSVIATESYPAEGSSISIAVDPRNMGYFDGHFYEFVEGNDEITWYDAHDNSVIRSYRGTNGYLAIIESEEEQDYMWNMYGVSREVERGLSHAARGWVAGYGGSEGFIEPESMPLEKDEENEVVQAAEATSESFSPTPEGSSGEVEISPSLGRVHGTDIYDINENWYWTKKTSYGYIDYSYQYIQANIYDNLTGTFVELFTDGRYTNWADGEEENGGEIIVGQWYEFLGGIQLFSSAGHGMLFSLDNDGKWGRAAADSSYYDEYHNMFGDPVEKRTTSAYYVEYGGPSGGEPVFNEGEQEVIPQPVEVQYVNTEDTTIYTTALLFGTTGTAYTNKVAAVKHENIPNTYYIYKEVKAGSDAEVGNYSGDRKVITFVYEILTYKLHYDPTGGSPVPSSVDSIYLSPLVTASVEPTRRAYQFLGWSRTPNGALVDFSTATHDVKADITLYAVWERVAWEVFFDPDGGSFGRTESMLVPIDPVTKVGNADITIYQPQNGEAPVKSLHGFLGWKDQDGNVAQNTFEVDRDIYLKAQWISLENIFVGNEWEENMVVYKNEATAQEVEEYFDVTASYTDLLGNVYHFEVTRKWETSVLGAGGIEGIRFYIADPATGNPIYAQNYEGTLYVLNRPYITGLHTHYMVVGELYPGDQIFNVRAYGEMPDLVNKRIVRGEIPLSSSGEVNAFEAGTYPVIFNGVFNDYFGSAIGVQWNARVIVHGGGQKSQSEREALKNAEASEFWVKVTEIYHEMKPGQIMEVNAYNYKDGGRLVSEGEIPEDAGYDRLIKVTPSQFYIMNPCILDRIEKDQEGQMIVYLEGERNLTFNSKDFETYIPEPKGHYDLRMGINQSEKISGLIPEGTVYMPLQFNMNRAWNAEPIFTVPVSEELQAAGEAGSDLYLFNYNENTDELELVGKMTPAGNGKYSICMTGVYGEYVITANLPKGVSYRITEQTNVIDSQTYVEIAENVADSGRTLPEGTGLSGISTATIKVEGEIEGITEINEKTTGAGKVIVGVLMGISTITLGVLYYKRKKETD